MDEETGFGGTVERGGLVGGFGGTVEVCRSLSLRGRTLLRSLSLSSNLSLDLAAHLDLAAKS